MTRDTRIQLIAAVTMAVLLGASGLLAVMLSGSAARARLVYTDRAEEGQPIEVNLGIAMGAFRGLFVNWLWIRANNLKEDGKFFESIELARAITKLQPRFPKVWSFHAWNLAYNISVTTQTRDERWRWVQSGINLLRKEGIPANPNDLQIHRELAWIHLHKIQGWMDDANLYYKKRQAEEWHIVLGPPPRLVGEQARERANVMAAYSAWMKKIADAEPSWEALAAKKPQAAALVSELKAANVLRQDDQFFDLLSRYESLRAIEKTVGLKPTLGPGMKALQALMSKADYSAAWPELIATTRRRVLEDKYNMEPSRMVRYMEKFGPMDYRNAAAHALYWSHRGVEQSRTRVTDRNRADFDFLNTDRVTMQAVQELYRSGDIFFDFGQMRLFGETSYMAVPNEHWFPVYETLLEEVVQRSDIANKEAVKQKAKSDVGRAYSLYSAGYENFVKDAIRFFYRRGQVELAKKYRADLIDFRYQNINDPFRNQELAVPIDQWVRKELEDRLTSPQVAISEVTGALMGAFSAGLWAGDNDLFRAQLQYAADAHRYFLENQLRLGLVDPSAGRMELMDRDFNFVAGSVFASFMQVLTVDDAKLVYSRAPENLRLYAYDAARTFYGPDIEKARTEQAGKPFDEIFPPPPGLDDHRQMIARRLQDQRNRRPGIKLQ